MDLLSYRSIPRFIWNISTRTSLLLLILLNFNPNVKAASCGFDGITSSVEDPYTVPAISDNLDEGSSKDVFWEHDLFGNVEGTVAKGDSHAKYISATYANMKYKCYANNSTKYFTKVFNSRDMYRSITVKCKDGTSSKFYLRIPFEDSTPPYFGGTFYNLTIPVDWDKSKPVSVGKFIMVSDNAVEITTDSSILEFGTSVENFLRIVPVKLWVDLVPRYFSYRLDLFLHQDFIVQKGMKQTKLFAKDYFLSGEATVQINFV